MTELEIQRLVRLYFSAGRITAKYHPQSAVIQLRHGTQESTYLLEEKDGNFLKTAAPIIHRCDIKRKMRVETENQGGATINLQAHNNLYLDSKGVEGI